MEQALRKRTDEPRHRPAAERHPGAAPAPQASAQRLLADAIDSRPSTAAQRALIAGLNDSPRLVAQRQQVQNCFGAVAQRQGGPEDDPGPLRQFMHGVAHAAVARVAQRAQAEWAASRDRTLPDRSTVVQRAGVKEQLSEAEATFGDFMNETALIDQTRTEVANAIYDNYKPAQATDRKHFGDKVAHKGVNPKFDRSVAYEKARRLNHWTQNSINAASRIYTELIAATDYNDAKGIGLEEITFGIDTDMEPDVHPSNAIAMETKRIDSASQGSVDSHVKKVSEQLDKREWNSIFGGPAVAVTKWVAHLDIANAENTWPYTPVAYRKAVKSKKLNPTGVGEKRIKKYQNSDKWIRYQIKSENSSIGSFSVKA